MRRLPPLLPPAPPAPAPPRWPGVVGGAQRLQGGRVDERTRQAGRGLRAAVKSGMSASFSPAPPEQAALENTIRAAIAPLWRLNKERAAKNKTLCVSEWTGQREGGV